MDLCKDFHGEVWNYKINNISINESIILPTYIENNIAKDRIPFQVLMAVLDDAGDKHILDFKP